MEDLSIHYSDITTLNVESLLFALGDFLFAGQ